MCTASRPHTIWSNVCGLGKKFGGVQARWSRMDREIYYMMAVAVDTSRAEPTFGKPAALFADEYDFGHTISIANYDVTRDGWFIMLRRGSHGSSFRVVIPWVQS